MADDEQKKTINDPEIACRHLYINGDKVLLTRCLKDLLFTALQCVNPGEQVYPGVEAIKHNTSNDEVVISIQTDGSSMPDESLETFFEVGGQRKLMKGGGDFGLRTAQAERIVQLFNGTVSVRNNPGQGICIETRIPRADAPADQRGTAR